MIIEAAIGLTIVGVVPLAYRKFREPSPEDLMLQALCNHIEAYRDQWKLTGSSTLDRWTEWAFKQTKVRDRQDGTFGNYVTVNDNPVSQRWKQRLRNALAARTYQARLVLDDLRPDHTPLQRALT